ncbi:hypothetical protein NUU61_003936 [Penicillium alfredii]|uniref:AAA+ ATPase domain-containing protein n=1 Tax=Penicillium alfredii TaxID=1506179 RepID=A0A9W9KCW1_9EURO|nr:uncharacterized protein NUU61_003936 [Penicillium alfredii]KAJ5101714.1 hypothetical protein NUU61_003936 [Penicillium alfredii]
MAPGSDTASPSETLKANGANGATASGNESKDETVKYAPIGSICDIHSMYESKPDESGNRSWTKELPSDLPDPAEDDESAQYALILRKSRCYDGRKNLELHSVVIQSQPLKNFLGKVLDGYPGVTTTLERLEFTKPFAPLVHRWETFLRVRSEEQDSVTKEHVELFYRILEGELRDVISLKKDLVANNVVTYDLVWSIFEPDDFMIGSMEGHQTALLFSEAYVDCRTKAWKIEGKFITFDGDDFGFETDVFTIPPFFGTTPITSLSAFPLRYHAGQAAIREALVARGKRWEEHRGYHFKQYEGPATRFLEDDEVKYNVKSRIIIDADAFNIFHPTESVSIDDKVDDTLTDDQRLITSPMVYGYSLKDKEWLRFALDNAHDIEWDSRAFDSLVLPEGQGNLKQLILAIAKAQSQQLDNFDDVVQGKGRGIILQLSGPPGVGKTLTAESVAEVMKVPLYAMSAGDLGTSAGRVEQNLKKILRMIPKWGAVLLLDEADVFMEARTSTDLERNELVSIFLRILDYYEGILFLTTNRAENIDAAFESRIHVSLAYRNLDASSRRHIWSQFLDTPSGPAFSSEQLDKVAAVELNGRQIKNVLKTANLLAQVERGPTQV